MIGFLTNQTCSIFPSVMGAGGLPTYADDATYTSVPCRVDADSVQIQTADNTTVESDAVIYLKSDATVARNSKIIVDSQEYIVDRIDTIRDLGGSVNHYECVCREVT